MRKTRQSRGWIGWALGVLAALTLVVSAPEHVLDFDEASGPVAAANAENLPEVEAHGLIHTILDHAAQGHACAAHCAAHVIGDAPLPAAILPPSRTPLIWPAAANEDGQAHPPSPLDRPPRA